VAELGIINLGGTFQVVQLSLQHKNINVKEKIKNEQVRKRNETDVQIPILPAG
jgi:hypothetical protein